jgi:hypothetical protein
VERRGTVSRIPNDAALRVQLACIGGHEPGSSYFELRPLTRDMEPAERDRDWVPVRQVDEAMRLIFEQGARLNAYIGVAPRVREGGKAKDVERLWNLWADLDGRDALHRLADFRPLPSLVIGTGSPDHGCAYWSLRDPISPNWAQRGCRRLALRLGGDIAATDPARILRPAGTLNHKHNPPREVVCERLELDVFTFGEVVGGLPDTHHYRERPRPPAERQVVGDASSALAVLARTVADAPEGKRNATLFWACCRVLDPDEAFGALDPNEAFAELHAAAGRAGLPELEIERTIRSGLETGARAAA